MRAAATVVLLRESASGLEALMMRRGSSLAFMAGMWVFPGGRLDAADESPAALSRVWPAGLARCAEGLHSLQGERLAAGTAIGLHVAACREAFEEAGLLLTLTSSGAPSTAEQAVRLQPHRAAVVSDATAFVRLLEAEDLRIDVGQFVYWSHWITPSLETKRFDTRFFVAPVPPTQDATPDLSELTEHAWIDPARAAESLERGVIKLAPPTLLTLEDIAESFARHGSLAAMLEAERGRATPPVMPKVEVADGNVRVLMPWDAGYETAAGEGVETGLAYPEHLRRRRSILTASLRGGVQL